MLKVFTFRTKIEAIDKIDLKFFTREVFIIRYSVALFPETLLLILKYYSEDSNPNAQKQSSNNHTADSTFLEWFLFKKLKF